MRRAESGIRTWIVFDRQKLANADYGTQRTYLDDREVSPHAISDYPSTLK